MLSRRMFAGCAICAAIGLVADDGSAQAPGGSKRTVIGRRDGPTEGYETVEVIVEIEPGFTIDWHTHPGTEAGYTLEGGGELRAKGEAMQATKAGVAWTVAAENPHTFKNGPQASKLLVTFVVQKGKPLSTPAPAPT